MQDTALLEPIDNNSSGLSFLCVLYNVDFLPGCTSIFHPIVISPLSFYFLIDVYFL